jgi:hypothetical protein
MASRKRSVGRTGVLMLIDRFEFKLPSTFAYATIRQTRDRAAFLQLGVDKTVARMSNDEGLLSGFPRS